MAVPKKKNSRVKIKYSLLKKKFSKKIKKESINIIKCIKYKKKLYWNLNNNIIELKKEKKIK